MKGFHVKDRLKDAWPLDQFYQEYWKEYSRLKVHSRLRINTLSLGREVNNISVVSSKGSKKTPHKFTEINTSFSNNSEY